MFILCHYLGGVKASEPPPHQSLKEVLATAGLSNVYIKLSGFAYCTHTQWDYPYWDTHWVVRRAAIELCWRGPRDAVRFERDHIRPIVTVGQDVRHAAERLGQAKSRDHKSPVSSALSCRTTNSLSISSIALRRALRRSSEPMLSTSKQSNTPSRRTRYECRGQTMGDRIIFYPLV